MEGIKKKELKIWNNEIENSIKIFALDIRLLSLQMVHNANASHIGGVLSMTDILAVLYSRILNFNIENPKWSNRDRFILSKGHCCVGVYASLAKVGFISLTELDTYAQDGSRLMSHISHKVPGVEFSTGSLGHGLSFAVGKALSAKLRAQKWNTYAILSDGELGEGSNWEAIMFAAHHKLDNLIAIIDYNKLQSLTTVDETLRIEPLADKFRSFGWNVREIDGHNHKELFESFQTIPWTKNMPSVIIAHTTKGKGVSFMENKVEWHYKSPNIDQLNEAFKELKSTI
jgi:transketolase